MHKLTISDRRKSAEKMLKDRESGLDVLHTLLKKGESDSIKTMFNEQLLATWRKDVLNVLTKFDKQGVLHVQEIMRVLKEAEQIERHRTATVQKIDDPEQAIELKHQPHHGWHR